MTHVLFFILATLAFIVGQWLFSSWYGGYRSVIDFYYQAINKSPTAGVWYYGSPDAARRRVRE